MKERPILFSGAMIRAILAGQKTQTRRLVKPQPHIDAMGNFCWDGWNFGQDFNGPHIQAIASPIPSSKTGRVHCPYGKPGDRLWVRETWAYGTHALAADRDEDGPFVYAADGTTQGRLCDRWRPSIHMPRVASRILLEVVSVRVERLQDCSSKDAIAEGIHHYEHFWSDCDYPLPDIAYEPVKGWPTRYSCPIEAYRALWDSINVEGSWAANPWVWVVEFKRVEEQPR